MKTAIILCLFISFAHCQILSMSARERREMRNDFAILDNAFTNGHTDRFVEFAEMFLERYKLASVSQNEKYRNLYNAVRNAMIAHTEMLANSTPQIIEEIETVENEELQRLFSQILLSPAEDIIAFSQKFPGFRERDVLGAFERARVSDLSSILATISRNSIPVNDIIRFSEIYGDEVSLERIRVAAERIVLRNIALLSDFRRVFGITEFDQRVEQMLYSRIMHSTDFRNIVTYMTLFPDGRYIGLVSNLAENYR